MQIAFGLEELVIGSTVWYYSDDRIVIPAIVHSIHPNEESPANPTLSLVLFIGKAICEVNQVKHVEEDNDLPGGYRLLKRWSFPQEVPYSDPDDPFQRFLFRGEKHPKTGGWNAAMTHYCSNTR